VNQSLGVMPSWSAKRRFSVRVLTEVARAMLAIVIGLAVFSSSS